METSTDKVIFDNIIITLANGHMEARWGLH